MPIPLRTILTLDWDAYVHALHVRMAHWQVMWPHTRLSLDAGVDTGWCATLAEFHSSTKDTLESLTDEERELLVGVHQTGPNTYFFGDLHAAGTVTSAIQNPANNRTVVAALDAARSGARSLGRRPSAQQGAFYWAQINNLFRFGPATASRLLLAERPDLYFMLNSKSRSRMETITGHSLPQIIDHSNGPHNYQTMLEAIYSSPWWNTQRPREPLLASLWDGRVALLDVFAYDPAEGA